MEFNGVNDVCFLRKNTLFHLIKQSTFLKKDKIGQLNAVILLGIGSTFHNCTQKKG